MNNSSGINFERAFTFMFQEDEWVMKFVIGVLMAVLAIFIIPGIILQGYVIAIARRVRNGQQPELPEWEDWGKFLSDGFAYMIAALIYALPMILLVICFMVIFLFGVAGADAGGSEDALAGLSLLMVCCLTLFLMLYALFMIAFLFVGTVNYIRKGSIGAFFQFGYLWKELRANLGRYGIVAIAAFAASMVGSIIPIVGSLWSQYATGHFLGQLARGEVGLGNDFSETALHDLT